jgi:uncharacterized membrane protein YphA (DoxX/SURF4 family)
MQSVLTITASVSPGAPRSLADLAPEESSGLRRIAIRTGGRRHGPITRLVSPSDIGHAIKPFVFLDHATIDPGNQPAFGIHPHSGLATLTTVLAGKIAYEDTTGKKGMLPTGGLEWMKAGSGVWHDGSVLPGEPTRVFQLWIALPPSQENSPPESQYIAPSEVQSEGPVRVILGSAERRVPFGHLRASITSTFAWMTDNDGGTSHRQAIPWRGWPWTTVGCWLPNPSTQDNSSHSRKPTPAQLSCKPLAPPHSSSARRSNTHIPWFSVTTLCTRPKQLWRAARPRSAESAANCAGKGAFDSHISHQSQSMEVLMSISTTTASASPSASSQEASPSTLAKVSELAGRILLATLFLVSGLGKVGSYAATATYMSSLGVPGGLLPLVIATEVIGGLAIMMGWKTRITAFLLAGFTLLTAFVFHNNFADQVQSIMFLKNVSIAGAFLLLVGRGAGSLSIDHWLARRPL